MRRDKDTDTRCRLRVIVRGAVQGVGFRPFVYRLAAELQLAGWVMNSVQGVLIEVEGSRQVLEQFLLRLEKQKPPRSYVHGLEASWLDPAGYDAFEIRHSQGQGAATVLILPDLAACPDCVRDIFDPSNRRYHYPFTTCTNCGPRFSIIERLPYDRPNTTMKAFEMCPECQAEYDDPANRRFHAQPNACPRCGPVLELWDAKGKPLTTGDACLAAAHALSEGRIIALKGLGGFQLLVAAHLDKEVQRLRRLKCREEKPFALMFPSLDAVKAECEISALEERLLCSPESPIVLLRRKRKNPKRGANPQLAPSIAPGNPNLGVMLPYTPLHYLLLSHLGLPVVATSGNLSDEPICIDNQEAIERLGNIADLFLCHNRPIVRHVDDSVVRIVAGRELVLRRARGYAPLPVLLGTGEGKGPVLGVGAHLKNSVALQVGTQAFISQHVGDLETAKAYEAFTRISEDLVQLYSSPPSIVAADLHPDYLSTRFAKNLVDTSVSKAEGVPGVSPRLVSVQHHLAHVLSCMAENELEPPVLGVSWDGTGLGSDGTVWGGEFIVVSDSARNSLDSNTGVGTARPQAWSPQPKDAGTGRPRPWAWERAGHLRPFLLPGGDKAAREPRRVALALLYEEYGDQAFEMTDLPPVQAGSPSELKSFRLMLQRKVNSPSTTSMGRLFDGVASLCGLRQVSHFEGQAAMELEFAAEMRGSEAPYPFGVTAISPVSFESGSKEKSTSTVVLDWGPLVRALVADHRAGVPTCVMAARFHKALIELVVEVAKRVGVTKVALTGGCFQNRLLLEGIPRRLEHEGHRPYWHQRVPPNDGGICLGQIVAALREKR